MISNLLIQLNWALLFLYYLPTSCAVRSANKARLLDANRVPLAALTSPGNFYLLHFPVNENDPKSPTCADGSPYSFAFRRGTDEHISKLIIEFEGGPGCSTGGTGPDWPNSCIDYEGSKMRRRTPWNDYLDFFNFQVILDKTFPELGSCRGVPSGFFTEASDVILSTDNAFTNDVPIPLRVDHGKGWWESIGGGSSNISDWSYILLPHCTMDLHLGHAETPQEYRFFNNGWLETQEVYHRGGTNVDAVVEWIQRQFPSGLDALVTTAGGKLGGCNASVTPTIAPAILASKLSLTDNDEDHTSQPGSSKLVVLEGSDLWDPLPLKNWNAIETSLPTAMEKLIVSMINTTQFVWIASDEGSASNDETLWFMKHANTYEDKFRVFQQRSLKRENYTDNWCPLYTIPDQDTDFSDFFSDVIEGMSWSSAPSSPSTSTPNLLTSLSSNDLSIEDEDNSRSRLSLLTIAIMLSGIVLVSWIIYFVIKVKKSQNGENRNPLSPTDLWFIALTKYPLEFFIVSLLVPIILSTIAFSRNELRINMDFDSYLQVDTNLENVRRNYNEAQENQRASLEIEDANCRLYGNSLYGNYRKLFVDEEYEHQVVDEANHDLIDESSFGNRKLLDELDLDIQIDQDLPLDMISPHHRKLSMSNLNYFSGGEWISIMYQNRKGGNVFEPDVLRAIHEFENSIYDFPEFGDYCYGHGRNHCIPIDSLVSKFFNNGNLVSDIDRVLNSFLVNRPALWKLDQYFGPDNLQSNVTRSFVFLRNMGGDQSAAHPFLRSFYRNFLLKHSQRKTYPEMVHTWNNFVLKQTEADDALLHDTLWSIASLLFISTMILLKVRSFFVAFFSILGLVLAFAVAYYWVSAHLLIENITLIWVAGLFVMLGIGADDIFLMVDSFDHTKHEFEEERFSNFDISIGDHDSNERMREDLHVEILRKRMTVAYKKAGSMMLVSSVTTAICFFSNAFGVLTVIQEFGIYMGMVVLVNYLHVMTILPSSILVNEIYVVPIQKDFIAWFKLKCFKKDEEEHYGTRDTDLGSPNESENDMKGHKKSKHKLNNLDRYLVQSYAPFVTKKVTHLIYFPIILAIVLGIAGGFNFSLNDGSIVLFSSRYNLGRLEEVTDRYYNTDEDVYTTIEDDKPEPTFPPARAPTSAPEPTIPPTQSNTTYQTINATITWINPEDAVAMGLPGAITLPPELPKIPESTQTQNPSQIKPDGSSDAQQIGDSEDINQSSQQSSEIQQVADSDDSNLASPQSPESQQMMDSDDSSQVSQQSPEREQIVDSEDSDQASQQPSESQQILDSEDLDQASQQHSETQQMVDNIDSSQASQQSLDSQQVEDGEHSDQASQQPSEIQEVDYSDDSDGATQQPSESLYVMDSDDSNQASQHSSETQQIMDSDDSDQGSQQSSETQQKEDSDDSDQGSQQSSDTQQVGESDDSNEAIQDVGRNGSHQGGTSSSGKYQGGTGGSGSASGTSSTNGSPSDSKDQEKLTSGGSLYKKPTNEKTSASTLRRRETIQVKLIWGVDSIREKPSLWITNSDKESVEVENHGASSPSLNLADPRTQQWLMTVVKMAKSNPNLFVREDKATWIERLRDYAKFAGVEFPIPERLFTTYLQLAKLKDSTFADLIDNEIGTSAPGLGGTFTYASIAMNVDAVLVGNAAKNVSMSEYIYKEWTEFAALTNKLSNKEIPDVVAQSSIFLDAYRVEATIDSTLMTWFVANGLCLLVILIFIQNLALSVMVMVTIVLILFCLGGLFFAVYRLPFGPVEALGVSIFIGLSANYSLHVVHAYHHSKGGNRESKIKGAVFAVGSPIIASALSTMGASAFLFACRTWVFIELGLLICSITGMALFYTMTFLFAWLANAGPVPIDEFGQKRLHQWDLELLYLPCKKKMGSTVGSTKDQLDENRSVYSIEVVDLDKESQQKIEQTKITNDDDDNDSVYSIEVIEDSNGNVL